MIGPNLSDWALKHRSFIVFAMIAISIAGLAWNNSAPACLSRSTKSNTPGTAASDRSGLAAASIRISLTAGALAAGEATAKPYFDRNAFSKA